MWRTILLIATLGAAPLAWGQTIDTSVEGITAGPLPAGPSDYHLLTQTYSGTMQLTKNLTQHECEFMRNRALGLPATNEEIAKAAAAAEAAQKAQQRDAEWEKQHEAECHSQAIIDFRCSNEWTPLAEYHGASDIKTAECFR